MLRMARPTAVIVAAATSALAACYDFSWEPPPAVEESDAAGEAPCRPARLTCGGETIAGRADTLYRCNQDGTTTVVARCANGCAARAPEEDDACEPPTPCVVGGYYCGGDKINGDPDVLYRCVGGGATVFERCANGCTVGAPGTDDFCER